jgi:CRISPR/Cas system Type II protein with McrA/HNH and RuvC-like nuclease domain
MECRSCKAVINANLNPKRTKEQLHESAVRRRIGDLLFPGEEKNINLEDLFSRFESKCFKTGKVLNINDRKSWAIDHILPSKYFYPLTKENAALLSREANENKRDNWPSKFYNNNELKRLAIITGANLNLISSKNPIVNKSIDVNAAVTRLLSVRGATDLSRRIEEIKKVLKTYGLADRLSQKNRHMLGI